ncbi:ATP-grasp domain-containing protein [Wenjunlia tyrosinilytica]|uniref:ATP-grasp domain-containing protein n=1 Tax=Wenjunlia tyrosinilytica TaxID=1544741 RepID=A0A917ZT10_9ACTN|nr:ATP-grasp domain-containing protein [Wenjunlia tyrosinilytica]GGO93674.1 hypothetical protein GCM10012280_46730 [Wenjunlia tyrosinilytica]
MNTPAKQRAFVLLELLNHMVLIAEEAKRRGFRVIALNHDPLRDSGPFEVREGVVDEVVPIASWSDNETIRTVILDLHHRYDVVGTYAAFEAVLPFEAELRELAGLPNSGAGSVSRALDKTHVRRKLYAEGLSELRSTTLTEALTWDRWQFERPAVLKPANGTGSALCFIVSSLEELHEAARQTGSVEVGNPLMSEYISAHGGFVLEEKAEGELLSVESLVDRGRVNTVGLTGRYVLAADPVVEQGVVFPYPHPRLAEITAKAEAFHKSLGISHGATHLEVMVSPQGPIELIDFNIRVGGVANVVSYGKAFGIDYAVPLTDIACGIAPDLSFIARPTRYAVDMLVLPPSDATELVSVDFPEAADCRRVTKPLGGPLSGRADQLDVIAMFVVDADDLAELHSKALRARRDLVVNGRPLGDDPNNILSHPRFIPLRRDASGGDRRERTPVTDIQTAPPAGTDALARLDTLYEEHFARVYDEAATAELREGFKREHVVPLRGFCPPALLEELRAEAFGIMDEHGVSRNLTFKVTDNTPRQMTTVGQPVIVEHGPLIHATYFAPAVKDLLTRVVGEEVFTCPYAGEHYVISRLGRTGDTHGWHWDDYTYGFVLILEAPHHREGGFVQAVPHTSWDKENPDVHGALIKSQVRSYAFQPGDAYVIKTDTTMHRVYPIRGEGRRTIVNMTWVNADDLERPMTHETNDILFGGAAPDPASLR